MKKNLITAVLILAVITSLTAGTLASYNKTLQTSVGNIHSKKFSFDKEDSKTFTVPINVVPGDKIEYEVTVNQETEVPMLYTGVAELKGAPGTTLVGRLSTMVSTDPNYLNGEAEAVSKLETGSQDSEAMKLGNIGLIPKLAGNSSCSFKILVEWKDSGNHAADVAANNQNATLEFTINGKSLEFPQIFKANDPKDTVFGF